MGGPIVIDLVDALYEFEDFYFLKRNETTEEMMTRFQSELASLESTKGGDGDEETQLTIRFLKENIEALKTGTELRLLASRIANNEDLLDFFIGLATIEYRFRKINAEEENRSWNRELGKSSYYESLIEFLDIVSEGNPKWGRDRALRELFSELARERRFSEEYDAVSAFNRDYMPPLESLIEEDTDEPIQTRPLKGQVLRPIEIDVFEELVQLGKIKKKGQRYILIVSASKAGESVPLGFDDLENKTVQTYLFAKTGEPMSKRNVGNFMQGYKDSQDRQ
jgi:hypothetical protein